MHINILFAVLASDFGIKLVVGEGPFREPPTVMQATIFDTVIFSSLAFVSVIEISTKSSGDIYSLQPFVG